MAVVKEEPPQVSKSSLLAATWALFGISFLVFIARISVRINVSRRLYMDDAWAASAVLILLGLSLVLTIAIPSMYEVLDVGSGLAQPTKTIMPDGSLYLKLQFASTMLYWSCLWAVKACFLAFFYRLTKGLKYLRWAWWTTAFITALSYCGCVVTYPVSCSSFGLGQCETQIHITRSLVSLRYSTAVDIITDAMIIALPMYLAMRVQLPWTQKLALAGIFSLGIVIMVFAVIRIAVTNPHNTHPETSWLNLWSQVEASVAVIISALAPFKAVFSARQGKSYESGKQPPEPQAVRSGKSTGLRMGQHQVAIPLDERSHAYADDGMISFKGKGSGDSTDRILGGYDVSGNPLI